jgi:release factor glutamine methyltransferase
VPEPLEIVIKTDKNVYEPAEDTELLIRCIKLKEADRILEIGTGTGVVAIHCAKHGSKVTATDICEDALELARENADSNSVDLDLRHGDLFGPVDGEFDVVIFNPPYLPTSQEDLTHSPLDTALDGGPDGTEVALRFMRGLSEHLAEEGRVFMVISSLQDTDRIEREILAHNFAYRSIGKERFDFETISVLELRRPPMRIPANGVTGPGTE